MTATLGNIAARIGANLHAPADSAAAERAAIDASHDSRQVGPGWLYCAVRGAEVDGHSFVPDVAASGAVGAVVERVVDLADHADLPQLVVPDGRAAMAEAACVVHGDPSHSLDVIGVTGTNGKSSIVQILSDLFEFNGRSTEILGTLQGPRTTPEATDLQRLLRRSVEAGREVVAMEVSSHALDLKRVAGTQFACAIFTNLGHDHLDFHETMEAYFEAKALLFTPAYSSLGVVNTDDSYGRRLVDRRMVSTIAYGLASAIDLRYEGVTSVFEWREQQVRLALAGGHNVLNAIAAAEAANALGLAPAAIAAGLARTRPVRGRFELVDGGQPFHIAVDYAHTPDALAAALVAARQVAGQQRVLLVFGCGGDRDVQKRPEMGRVAEKGADVVVITSDNPRSEAPAKIAEAIIAGLVDPKETEVVLDRREAITRAVQLAEPGDLVLIAGKGHETYQVIGNQTLDFDDGQVALEVVGATA